ncbi:ATP-binding protein [Lactobacillus sp. PV012]|uniref:ATP-binding protein n=1 Tax=Lactobacillus sp. PV012 TaxID=2594494 RepID=UPI002240D8F9|nr:ATP-binding protein [Lactobacillus sp. PV012]QNQ82754.1 transcriptional regulator [Lactobacillus sp. PV012]
MKNEDNFVEYKRELTNKLKREIVAFLNTKGGKIYLGVDDETLEPLDITKEQKHEWEETLNHWYTNAFYPTPFSLLDIQVNNDPFLLKVKEGRHKPYSIEKNGLDSSGVYLRVGSSSVRATNEQVKRMIQQNVETGEFDAEKASNQELSFNTLKKRLEETNMEFSVGSLRMVDNFHFYNNAAYLVSDQNMIETKVAIYQGSDVSEFKDKRAFSGSIISQINDLLYYISLNNQTKVQITGSAERKEIQNFPEIAIREAIVNAFAHRDYLLHSFIKIEIFDDRLEILSPGGIPDGLTLEEIKDGMTAVRNPQLVHILDKIKYIENFGTGIRRMYEVYKGANLEPRFEVRENSFKVILPNVNWKREVQDKALDTKKDNQSLENLSISEESILLILEKNGRQSRKEIQKILNTTPYRVRKLLQILINKGKVRKIGVSVNTQYQKA